MIQLFATLLLQTAWTVTDLDGNQVELPTETERIVFVHDARGGRILKSWLDRGAMAPAKTVVVAEISHMPQRVRDQEFIPTAQASGMPIFLLAENASDVPRQARRISVLEVGPDENRPVTFAGSLAELLTVLRRESP